MGYQKIAGIKVTPVGAQGPQGPTQGPRIRSAPFNHAQAAPASGRAFGGWIYGGNLQMGFAESPTTLSLDIALDTQTDGGTLNNASAGIGFDIGSGDLKINHNGTVEGYYKINVGSTEFGPMYLTSYEINASAESKTLKVEFTDYSAILDKIYVGLFKGEGYQKNLAFKLVVNPSLDALCPDCSLTSSQKWHVRGNAQGIIETAAYFINHHYPNGQQLLMQPINRENYANYFTRKMSQAPFAPWTSTNFPINQYAPSATDQSAANINGGTLIIGTEEFNENICADLSNVTYNFSELLHALAKLKLKFTQVNSTNLVGSWSAHISGKLDKNPNYRQSYNGTLREVLNNWCGDFGLNFHITGKTICFTDTSAGVNLGNLPNAMIPMNALGQVFNSDKNNAIGNFSEKFDIRETYAQNIVTADVRPRTVKETKKDIKNVCGFIATHPLDWLYHDGSNFNGHRTMFEQPFTSKRFLNDYALSSNANYFNINPIPPGRSVGISGPGLSSQSFSLTAPTIGAYRHYWYTNRALCVIDTCAALIKYDESLRDIYAGSFLTQHKPVTTTTTIANATSAMTQNIIGNTSRQNAFNSFGFIPLMHIGDNLEDFKESILEKNFSKKAPDGTSQNYILVPDQFQMWIGFYDAEEAREIKEWEKNISEDIGRYGILAKGNLAYFPYLSSDRTDQPSSLAGLTGVSGLEAIKISSVTEPASENYIDYNSDKFPFRDIFKASGNYLNAGNSNFNLTGLYVAQLENEWGSYQNDISLKLKQLATSTNNNCDSFKDASVANTYYDNNTAPGTFSLQDFAPRFIKLDESNLDELEEELSNALHGNQAAQTLLGKIVKVNRETRIANTTAVYSETRCPKLHIMVVPDVACYAGQALPVYPNSNNTPKKNPHCEVSFSFNKKRNLVMFDKLRAFAEEKNKQKIKQIPPNICDISMLDDVCNNGFPLPAPNNPGGPCPRYSNNPTQSQNTIGNPTCKCKSAYTGDFYNFFQYGFRSGLIDSQSCRNINVNIRVHPHAHYYNSSNYTDNRFGGVSAVPVNEDFPPYTQYNTNFDITYPIESRANSIYNYYSGLLTQSVEIQVRSPENINIFGNYWNGTSNVAKIQHINNQIEQDIDAQINPSTKSFFQPVYDMLGNKITGTAGYHDLIKNLSLVSNLKPAHQLNFEIIGDAASINLFRDTLKPANGLSSLSFSLGQDGFRTNVSYASIPAKMPKREAILNKINPRLNKL